MSARSPSEQSRLARVRRINVLALYEQFKTQHWAQQQTTEGSEQAFAALIGVSPQTWSMMKGARPIGDRMARQVEQRLRHADGWLDVEHQELTAATPTASKARAKFLAAAAAAWDAENSAGRRELMTLMLDRRGRTSSS